METYDTFGRPTSLVHFVTICPVQYLEQGKELALQHLQSFEQVPQEELTKILPTALCPQGEGEPTHYFCGRWVDPKFIDLQVVEMRRLHAEGLEWMGDRLYTLDDDPELIRTKFSCLVAQAVEVLALLGIQEPIRPVGV